MIKKYYTYITELYKTDNSKLFPTFSNKIDGIERIHDYDFHNYLNKYGSENNFNFQQVSKLFDRYLDSSVDFNFWTSNYKKEDLVIFIEFGMSQDDPSWGGLPRDVFNHYLFEIYPQKDEWFVLTINFEFDSSKESYPSMRRRCYEQTFFVDAIDNLKKLIDIIIKYNYQMLVR